MSGLWRRTRSAVEEPGAHLRMPRLRSPDVDNGRDGDAPVEVAADGVVLGRASHGDALEWHVGSPARSPARHHVQDGLVARAEAPTIDDRSPPRAAGGRGGGRPGRNSLPGQQQLFRSREIREDPYRWRCRGDRPAQTGPSQGGNERNTWILGLDASVSPLSRTTPRLRSRLLCGPT